ncbi:hypothetical protein B1H18_03210 [Streptomyces tsukubensis]|uniref:Uncharacterized protein n=1 Tax=Streptomyces tsukubensis TaxID=83656 RepID=A0A1V4AEW5_9ACTN|nr:hypothetical protein B1H18_03210 [Streptomyces tsukubensis]
MPPEFVDLEWVQLKCELRVLLGLIVRVSDRRYWHQAHRVTGEALVDPSVGMVHMGWCLVRVARLLLDFGPVLWIDELGPLTEHPATSRIVDRGAFAIEDISQQGHGAQDFHAGLMCVECLQCARQGLRWQAVTQQV